MKLDEYLKTRNITQADFAEKVGVEQATISRLMPRDGEPAARKPSFDLMAKIAAATSGAVMPNDFMDDLPGIIAGFPDPDEQRRAG